MNSFLKILSWFAIAAGIVLVVVGITFLFIPKYQRMCGLESRCRHLREQVENKQHEIHAIRVKQGRLLTDPEFVARIAHENRRVFPGELVFVAENK
jgi:CHASE3 domain sensor protein